MTISRLNEGERGRCYKRLVGKYSENSQEIIIVVIIIIIIIIIIIRAAMFLKYSTGLSTGIYFINLAHFY